MRNHQSCGVWQLSFSSSRTDGRPPRPLFGDKHSRRSRGRLRPEARAFGPRTFTVTVGPHDPALSVRLARVRAPRAVPRGTRIRLDVDLETSAETPAASVVTVSAGAVNHPDIEVARASHTWTSES